MFIEPLFSYLSDGYNQCVNILYILLHPSDLICIIDLITLSVLCSQT